jgi:hypothetical protein
MQTWPRYRVTVPSGQANDVPIDIENNVEGLDWEVIAEKVRHLGSSLSPVDETTGIPGFEHQAHCGTVSH